MLDLEKYNQLATEKYNQLVYFAKGKLNKSLKQEAEDVVSDALLVAWKNKDSITHTSAFIGKCIINFCFDRNRRNKTTSFKPLNNTLTEKSLPDVETEVFKSNIIANVDNKAAWERLLETGKPSWVNWNDKTGYAAFTREREALREKLCKKSSMVTKLSIQKHY